jgi:DNA ligase-1
LNVESPSRLRWRKDKSVDEADSLATLQNLLG